MKKFLLDLIARKKTELKATELRFEASKDEAEVRALGDTLKVLRDEISDAEEQLKKLEEEDKGNDKGEGEGEGDNGERSEVPEGAELRNAQVVASFKMAQAREKKEDDLEYRNAFMEFVLRNKAIPAELRDNTKTSDVASVIPTQLVNKIIEKFDNVGMILPLITKTSYKAGVEVPTSSVKPVATWVGTSDNLTGEGAGSTRQKKTTGVITFSYYKLRCEISMSMEVGTMALAAFEAKFIENVAKAMTYAVENSVINGTGVSQPKGILTSDVPEGQALTGALDYAKLVEAEGVLPVEYEAGAKWCMNKKTFAKVMGMVDQQGQPIARVNFGLGGKPERTINGREVVITPYVADNEMFIYDFSDYVLNTIYDMGISKKQDWDTEDLLTKAVMSVDGKPVDLGSLVKLTVTLAA